MRLWQFQYVYVIFLIFHPYRSLQVCEKIDHFDFAFYLLCDHFMIDDIKHSTDWSYDTFIEIRTWNSTEITPHMFQSWNPLKKLTITSSNIQILQNEAFDGLNLTHLDLPNNTIMHIDAMSFNGLQQLSTLDLSYNRIIKIDNGTFNSLNHLRNVFLNNNNITFLPKGILVATEELDLSHNSISYIEKDTFYQLHRLHRLDLQNNRIGYLNVNNFNGLDNLYILNLTRNNLVNIETGAFNGLQHLNQLDLSYNNLSIIKKDTFTVLLGLQFLSLRNNRIMAIDTDTFNNLNNLMDLDLRYNSILTIEKRAFNGSSNLRTISLINNKITTISIDAFNNLYELQYLYLSNNQIAKLPIGCFKHLKELSYLDLSFNNISSLDSGNFVGLYNLRYLNLSHNYLTTFNKGIFHDIDRILTLDISYNNFVYIDVENTLSHIVSRDIAIYLEGNQWLCSLLTQIITQNKNLKIQQGNEHNVTNIQGNYCTNEKPQIVEHFKGNESQDFNLTTTVKVNGNHTDKLEQFQENINTSRDKGVKLPNLKENLWINDDIDKVYRRIEDRIDLRMEESNRKLAIVEDLLIFVSILLTITVIIVVREKCMRYLPFKCVSCRQSNSESEQEIELMH